MTAPSKNEPATNFWFDATALRAAYMKVRQELAFIEGYAGSKIGPHSDLDEAISGFRYLAKRAKTVLDQTP